MRQSYNEKPEATWLEVLNKTQGGACILHFNENIEEAADTEGNGQATYTADHYSMDAIYRENLLESVEANRAAWLATAIKAEEAGNSKTALEVLQESIAELQASNTELQEANVQLQAVDEELNSAIDELTIAILEGVM